MRIEIKKTICDCEEGELEKIAETIPQTGWTGTHRAQYLECSSCNKIYKLYQGTRSGYGDRDGNEFSPITEFKELSLYPTLTREQIIKFAPGCIGEITSRDVKKIMEREQRMKSVDDKAMRDEYEKAGWAMFGISYEAFLEHEVADIGLKKPPQDLSERTIREMIRVRKHLRQGYKDALEKGDIPKKMTFEEYLGGHLHRK